MNGNLLLSPDALHCLKRKQLTNLCRRFGIKAIGKNADLIQLLQEYAASNIPTDSPTKGNVPILRHVKRPRQSDESQESASDDVHPQQRIAPLYPPLTPRTRQKRVSDMVAAIEQMKEEGDQMDTDEEEDDEMPASRRNTITFPSYSPAPARQPSPLLPTSATEGANSTQPLRIVKALPSMNRLASPLSAMTIFESSPTPASAVPATSSLYPDLSTLPLPQGVSSEGLASSSTLPSITSRQFSAAAASVLAEMNARLTAAGRSATSGTLATLSSMGNGTWQNLAASSSSQGMSKSRSGRYEIRHERQFNKMDSIVNHYAARRVGAGVVGKDTDASKSGQSSGTTSSTSAGVAAAPRLTASASSQRRPRMDASTSTRSLAAMTKSTSTRQVPRQRRPLPVPPVSQARMPSAISTPTTTAKSSTTRQASTNTTVTTASSDSRVAKRLRLAVTEDHDALQNTVLEIPPEKKSVMIKVTRPEREGMPYKFSVASSSDRAASTLRKTVIKATKGISGAGSGRKTTTSGMVKKREEAIVRQQQHQAAVSRSMSSRANLADKVDAGVVRNRFTGVTTVAEPRQEEMRKASVAASALTTATHSTEASKHGSISSRLTGSLRSSVSQSLTRADAARQARLKDIKARTKAALTSFASQRNVSASTTQVSPRKPIPTIHETFSHSVMRPTIASLNRSTTPTAASAPMLSNLTAPTATLQRATTVAGVGKILTPCLTPRSSSLRHLRRVMRRQQKEAEVEGVRVAAAENIAPGDVVPSVVKGGGKGQQTSIRTVTSGDGLSRMRTPAGPREALGVSRATMTVLNGM